MALDSSQGSELLPSPLWRSRCPFLRSSGLLSADSEDPRSTGALEWIDSQLTEVPYFGVMFGTFEFCKRVCLYQNGYTVSPLSYNLTPGVDQSLKPQELRELKKFKTGKLKSKKPTV